jgi:hypothetical protein
MLIMSAELSCTKLTACSQYVDGTKINCVAPVARIALIAACAETSHVVDVIDDPTGSFISPKITFGVFK